MDDGRGDISSEKRRTYTLSHSTYTSLAEGSFTITEATTGVELCELDSDSLEEVLSGS